MSDLPPIPEDSFDGEKYSVELKTDKCKHDVEYQDNSIRCKKCGCRWTGPQLDRLYEAFKSN